GQSLPERGEMGRGPRLGGSKGAAGVQAHDVIGKAQARPRAIRGRLVLRGREKLGPAGIHGAPEVPNELEIVVEHGCRQKVAATWGRITPSIRAVGKPCRRARSAGVAITVSPIKFGQKTTIRMVRARHGERTTRAPGGSGTPRLRASPQRRRATGGSRARDGP